MNKKSSVLFVFILIASLSYCQNTFVTTICSPNNYHSPKICALGNSYYIAANRMQANLIHNACLFKLDIEGVVVDSLILYNDQYSVLINEMIKLDNGNLSILGTSEINATPGFYELFFFELDDDLNIINSNYYNRVTHLVHK
ncbi:hypothetical protein [Lentimicrobium sp. S6]|uniref:hypothetical protein n=1 Tax=Lentimicrobium sp. S6 TaxID=2735872 RepID=UPI0015549060|nr:hypothetical protein [Lentimicrobium sp. S6]NPD48280.1 hypothetical protein [Lentimicrobium sp. S6]